MDELTPEKLAELRRAHRAVGILSAIAVANGASITDVLDAIGSVAE